MTGDILASGASVAEKVISNMEEVRARGGQTVLISDAEGIDHAGEGCTPQSICGRQHTNRATGLCHSGAIARLPDAVVKGANVDGPCNLAKPGTVE